MTYTSSTMNNIAHSGLALAGVVLVVVVVNQESGAP
jgi:hypothetical protein